MKPAGATEAAAAVATLSRFDNGRELVINRGIPDDAFGKAVDSLFMDELGFSRVRAYRARQGEAAEHGWPAMCAALFITGPGDTLFGDTAQDAIAAEAAGAVFVAVNTDADQLQAIAGSAVLAVESLSSPEFVDFVASYRG